MKEEEQAQSCEEPRLLTQLDCPSTKLSVQVLLVRETVPWDGQHRIGRTVPWDGQFRGTDSRLWQTAPWNGQLLGRTAPWDG